MTHPYDFRKQLEMYLIGFLVLIALLYGGFRAYPLIAGPKIIIYTPNDNESVASSTFKISGKVLRTNELFLQGRSITVDTDGNFSETLVPQYPYTIIVITATDSYGSSVTKTLRVIPE